ncbi:MAG: TolC family protein [Rickettsiales bacterium]|jgi:outer membrane protein TolC|nr:TolC family protein [Rickettsiales bacterium]
MKKILHAGLAFCLLPFALSASDCNTRTTIPEYQMSLQAVVEMGLCRNPTTAAAYLSAESARLNKNAGYAPYLPSINANAGLSKPYKNKELGDNYYSAGLSASWLIFDFGKRLADLNNLSAVWRATGFDYDESVQNYVYGVIGSYYGLLTADADVRAAADLQKTAQTAKDTADKKFKAGAVAKADVLKAETTLAQRKLESERAGNNREIAKAKLLAQLSFSPEQNIQISDMPSEFGAAAENKSIDDLIADAKKNRPDLLRAGANSDAAWHRRNAAFLKNLPSISATGNVGWGGENLSDTYNISGNKLDGSIGVRASMPIFAGFANLYGLRAAEANYDRTKELERNASDNAGYDVFSAYQNYKTAQKVLEQTDVLLKSATESERVTAGMYNVGRASMLDWQTAQSELASATRQSNSAKYDLFVKRAGLALAVGDIKSELKGK